VLRASDLLLCMTKKDFSIELGGKTLTAEFTDLAEQANGSVIMKYGNTTALVTATMSKGEKDTDFFPLTVDYEERFYAAGGEEFCDVMAL